MARGPAPKPKDQRRNRNPKMAGDWHHAEGIGWQHGDVPASPDGLLESSRSAWASWMSAWYAAHWSPEDLPGLRTLIKVYDQVERGEYQRAAELRLQMDGWGITPKGQQQLRWSRPPTEAPVPARSTSSRRGKLKVV